MRPVEAIKAFQKDLIMGQITTRQEYEITYRARRFKYRRALATVFFTSKRAAERYAREHFTASEQAQVRILSGK